MQVRMSTQIILLILLTAHAPRTYPLQVTLLPVVQYELSIVLYPILSKKKDRARNKGLEMHALSEVTPGGVSLSASVQAM